MTLPAAVAAGPAVNEPALSVAVGPGLVTVQSKTKAAVAPLGSVAVTMTL